MGFIVQLSLFADIDVMIMSLFLVARGNSLASSHNVPSREMVTKRQSSDYIDPLELSWLDSRVKKWQEAG
jgi:hypothetical protein